MRRRGAPLRAAVAVLTSVVVSSAPSPVAGADEACLLDDQGVLTVVATGPLVLWRDAGGSVHVDGLPEGVSCPPVTVDELSMVAATVTGRLTLDLADGWLLKTDGTSVVPLELGMPGPEDLLEIRGSEGDDQVRVGRSGAELAGGGPPDVTGPGGAGLEEVEGLQARGRGGADAISLRGGDDLGEPWADETILDGGDGDDRLQGGDGPDDIRGGPGEDTADYSDRWEPLTLVIGLPDASGAAFEGDSLTGLERLVGGAADDLLEGAGMNEALRGGPGADTLRGASGLDLLVGGPGADRLVGGREADRLAGGDGRDVLRGGDAGDRLDGGAGRDRGDGGPGRDVCEAVERTLSCEVFRSARPARLGAAARSTDPILAWSTFLGGRGDDVAGAIARVPTGGVVVVGTSVATWGTPIRPFVGGGSDAFVARLDGRGRLLWTTFLGGPGQDVGSDVEIAPDGAIHVAGWSAATWGQPRRAFRGRTDGFVAQLDPTGTLVWSTFLGGGGRDRLSGIALGGDRIVVVGTSSASWGSPLSPFAGGTDVAIAALGPGGSLRWTTFLGGPGEETGSAVAAVPGALAAVGVGTEGLPAPLAPYAGGASDAVVGAGDAAGSFTWSTYLGGPGADVGRTILARSAGGWAVGGWSTAAWGAPVGPFGGRSDGLLAVLASDGGLAWHTFLGGAGWDRVCALVADPEDRTFAVGDSSAPWGTPARPHAGGRDAFLALVGGAGDVSWNAFLGGAGDDEGAGLALGEGRILVAGTSDASWGEPVRAFRGGWSDAFVASVRASAVP